jgi:hypothetical protein
LCWLGRWLLVVCLLPGGLPTAHAFENPVDITALRADRADDGVFLSVQLRLDLPASVDESLRRGLALFFVAEAELQRERWYWTDRRVTASSKYFRLAYQPLTRRWRLNVSSEPLTGTGLNPNFSQHFDSLPEALQAMQRISHWKIAEANALEADTKHSVDFHFRLDVSQLPRPLQMGVMGSSDWDLGASRKVSLRPESAK